jgi:hypothetical protein
MEITALLSNVRMTVEFGYMGYVWWMTEKE